MSTTYAPSEITLSQSLEQLIYSSREVAILTKMHDFPLPIITESGMEALYDWDEIEKWRLLRMAKLSHSVI